MDSDTLRPIKLRYGTGVWNITAENDIELVLGGCFLASIIGRGLYHVDLWLNFSPEVVADILSDSDLSSVADPFAWSEHAEVASREEAVDLVLSRLIDCGLLDPIVYALSTEENGD